MAPESCKSADVSRRRWLLGGAALVGASACGPRRGTGYPGYALIATAGQKSVAAVDLTLFRLQKSIALPGEPGLVVATPDGGAFVLMESVGALAHINQDLKLERSRRVAESLTALRRMPDGKQLVAVDPNRRELLLLDAGNFNVAGRRRMHEAPTAIDISQAGDLIVTANTNGAINLLNLRTGDWRHTELKPGLGSVLFRFDGEMLLVANLSERILTALRVPDLAVLAELPLAMEPSNLCFTQDGGQLFASGEGMDAVAIVFPYNALEVEQTVLVGRDPGAMVCSDASGYLFVGSAHGSDVSIMRVDTRKSVGAVDVESQPSYLALTPDGQYALVLCQNSGDVAVIRVGAIRANLRNPGVALFTMLPVGERPVQCAFVPKQLV